MESFDKECDHDENYPTGNSKIQRDQWPRKIEYMLSMIGYSVGLGNIWRFPYICMRNGGGAFLIPFLFFLLACGFPLYFLEVSIGQFTGTGVYHVWEVCALLKGVGVGMTICLLILTLYYNIIITWTLYYLGVSFISPLPWRSCDNTWNTPGCISDNAGDKVVQNLTGTDTSQNFTLSGVSNATAYNVSGFDTSSVANSSMYTRITAEEEYWQYNVLHISEGIHDLGGIPWHLAVCFLAAWFIIFLCLIKGIKSVGKVVYVTALLPPVLLTVILIRGLTLPGSLDGVLFYIRPDFQKLLSVQVWIEACLQVFYSLGPCWGSLITMASYNKFNNNSYRDALILTLISEGTSIYGGFAVFSVLGYIAYKSDLPIGDVVKSGPGLGYITYPEAIALLPLPNLWAVLFFFMLLAVGLDSEFGNVEACITVLTDSYPRLRKRRVLVTAISCAMCFLVGLPMCTQGGMYIFQIMDWYIASAAMPLFGILECVGFGWIYGAEMVSRDIEMMIGHPVGIGIRLLWCFVTPVILLLVWIFTLSNYQPPTYGNYVFPGYMEVIGWIIALLPVIPIPVFAVLAIIKSPETSLTNKLKDCLRPTDKWIPVATEERNVYRKCDREYNCGVIERVKLNILGHS